MGQKVAILKDDGTVAPWTVDRAEKPYGGGGGFFGKRESYM
jgi:hypothetical protein